MHDLLFAIAFISILIAPAIVAARLSAAYPDESE